MPTWMNRSKESEAARQEAMRAKRQQAGNCIRCGFAVDSTSVQLCTRHLALQRDYANKRNAEKRAPVMETATIPSTERPLATWQRVESARRLWSKGDGWWEIWLTCGHGAAVLHGAINPLGESVHCFHCGYPAQGKGTR